LAIRNSKVIRLSIIKKASVPPLGKLKNSAKSTALLSLSDLENLGFKGKQKSRLEFASGIVVEGTIRDVLIKNGKTLMIAFTDCTVTNGAEILFKPEWGTFDLACGEKVVSVFGGAADRAAYDETRKNLPQKPRPQKRNVSRENEKLIPLYAKVRELRETGQVEMKTVETVIGLLDRDFPNDWLLRLELIELLESKNLAPGLTASLRANLDRISRTSENLLTLIRRGLDLIRH
jgi:phenylalanine-4-hydroxylase